MKRSLKWVRVGVAAVVFALVTLFFLGLGGGFGLLEKVQLGPALLGCAGVPLAVWLVVTLVFGRVYCSAACPLGILQDVLGRLAHPRGRRRFAFTKNGAVQTDQRSAVPKNMRFRFVPNILFFVTATVTAFHNAPSQKIKPRIGSDARRKTDFCSSSEF